MRQTVIVLDFGGQYNQLIARRVREQNVYCEILPYNTDLNKIREKAPIGIIFTGGPKSVYAEDAPRCGMDQYRIAGLHAVGLAQQIGGRQPL